MIGKLEDRAEQKRTERDRGEREKDRKMRLQRLENKLCLQK